MNPLFLLIFAFIGFWDTLEWQAPTKYYLSVVAIFRDEAKWLPEWLEYHLLVGVEHFYLINHKSEDNYLEVLQPYIDKGLVTLTNHWEPSVSEVPMKFYSLQHRNYEQCIARCKWETYWLATLDLDEFLVPMAGDSLPPILQEFHQEVGIQVNWTTFGTGGVEEIPSDQLLIETLLWRAPDYHDSHYLVKSIVRPPHVNMCCSAHYFLYKYDRCAVDTNHTPQPPRSPHDMGARNRSVLRNKMVVHHYRFRDERYLKEEKAKRGHQYNDMRFYTDAVMNQVNREASVVQEETMVRFIPELRKRLGLDEHRAEDAS